MDPFVLRGLTPRSRGGHLTFQNIVGDVRELHLDPTYAGAVFQVASQVSERAGAPWGHLGSPGVPWSRGLPVVRKGWGLRGVGGNARRGCWLGFPLTRLVAAVRALPCPVQLPGDGGADLDA